MPEKHYFVKTLVRKDGEIRSSDWDPHVKQVWPNVVGTVMVAPNWDPNSRGPTGIRGLRPWDQLPFTWPGEVWVVCSYNPTKVLYYEGSIAVPECTIEVVYEGELAPFLTTKWLRERGFAHGIYFGREVVGVGQTAVVGSHGVAEGGNATAGFRGRAYAIGDGLAKAGDWGYAQAGRGGTAIVGKQAEAFAGINGYASAGPGGRISIEWVKNEEDNVRRLATAYVGEDGIEPHTLYKLDSEGRFVKANL